MSEKPRYFLIDPQGLPPHVLETLRAAHNGPIPTVPRNGDGGFDGDALQKSIIASERVQAKFDRWRSQAVAFEKQAAYDNWYLYGLANLPDIPGYGRHAYLTGWYHAAPFGQPRGVNLVTLRTLSQSWAVNMMVQLRCNEIASLDWDFVPIEKGMDAPNAIKDARAFLDHPNNNQESFMNVLKAFLRDLFTLDSGVMVKTFEGGTYEQKYAVPNMTVKDLDGRDFNLKKEWGDIITYDMPKPTAHLAEIYARDGGSFLKQTDPYGIVYGYWQYSFTYPATTPTAFSDREIIFAMANPLSYSPYGWSPLQSIDSLLNTLVNSTLHNEKFFEKKMVPPGILAVLGMSRTDFDLWEAYFNEKVRGDPYRIPVISPGQGGDVKWVNFAPTPKDLEFLQTQEWYLKLVASSLEVNFNELGFTDTLHRSTAEEQSHVFRRRSIQPLLKLLEYYINLEIVRELWAQGMTGIEFKFTPFIDTTEKARIGGMHAQDIQTGKLTTNEIREEELGLEPNEWGQAPQWWWEYKLKLRDIELREKELIHQRDQMSRFNQFRNPLNPQPNPLNPRPPQEKQPNPTRPAPRAPESQEPEKVLTNSTGGPRILSQSSGSDVDWDEYQWSASMTPEQMEKWARFHAEYTGNLIRDPFYDLPNPSDIAEQDPRAVEAGPLMEQFQRELRALFDQQETEVLKALGGVEKAMPFEQMGETFEALDKKHLEQLLAVSQDYIFRAIHRGGNKAHEELRLKLSFELDDPDAERFMQDFSSLLAHSKFFQIRSRIHKILLKGLAEGASVVTMAQTIQKEFAAIKGHEAERIARTETMRAMNFGREIGYKRANVVKSKQWLVTWDDRSCEVCLQMAGQTIPLQMSFTTPDGLTLQNPPLHPNCRCTIVPVLDEENVGKSVRGKPFTKSDKMQEIEVIAKGFDSALTITDVLSGMYEGQMTTEAMGDALGTTKQTISNWLNLMEIPTRPVGFPVTKAEQQVDQEGHKGRWVTIAGRRIFIREGEDIKDAFERAKKETKEKRKGSERERKAKYSRETRPGKEQRKERQEREVRPSGRDLDPKEWGDTLGTIIRAHLPEISLVEKSRHPPWMKKAHGQMVRQRAAGVVTFVEQESKRKCDQPLKDMDVWEIGGGAQVVIDRDYPKTQLRPSVELIQKTLSGAPLAHVKDAHIVISSKTAKWWGAGRDETGGIYNTTSKRLFVFPHGFMKIRNLRSDLREFYEHWQRQSVRHELGHHVWFNLNKFVDPSILDRPLPDEVRDVMGGETLAWYDSLVRDHRLGTSPTPERLAHLVVRMWQDIHLDHQRRTRAQNRRPRAARKMIYVSDYAGTRDIENWAECYGYFFNVEPKKEWEAEYLEAMHNHDSLKESHPEVYHFFKWAFQPEPQKKEDTKDNE